ncbi:hypothetical protein [Streptomyces sp. NPDC000618]|uniref:hypothetical protein n=1 Tax=Streptomyces sp. NPDC000618 TaxID=3154265 RepID=UPI00332ED1B8
MAVPSVNPAGSPVDRISTANRPKPCDSYSLSHFNTDVYPDIVAMAPGGTLRLFPGDIGHDLLTPVTNFPSGWNGYTFAGIGNFNGDGNPDVIVRDDTTRILWLYPRTATAFSTRQQIGNGW